AAGLGLVLAGPVAQLTRRIGAPAPRLTRLGEAADVQLARHEVDEAQLAQHLHWHRPVLDVAAVSRRAVAQLPAAVVAPAPRRARLVEPAREVAARAQMRDLEVTD